MRQSCQTPLVAFHAGEKSYSHHTDMDVGLTVTDRVTYHGLQWFNRIDVDSNATLQEFLDFVGYALLVDAVVVRTQVARARTEESCCDDQVLMICSRAMPERTVEYTKVVVAARPGPDYQTQTLLAERCMWLQEQGPGLYAGLQHGALPKATGPGPHDGFFRQRAAHRRLGSRCRGCKQSGGVGLGGRGGFVCRRQRSDSSSAGGQHKKHAAQRDAIVRCRHAAVTRQAPISAGRGGRLGAEAGAGNRCAVASGVSRARGGGGRGLALGPADCIRHPAEGIPQQPRGCCRCFLPKHRAGDKCVIKLRGHD